MELFKNKYRIKSHRLKNWNYTNSGAYFITICTKNKEQYFGKIINKKMTLNEIGKIADNYWQEIPKHFKNVKLDKYVVMPNHVHGILMIDKNGCNDVCKHVACENKCKYIACRDVALQRLYVGKNPNMSKISPKKHSISSIIRSYKSICTKMINKIPNEISFTWQPRFHDHIIRNKNELNRIRQYIINNPVKWERDRNYVKN